MRLSDYPMEERLEWLDNPMTRGFIEEMDALVRELQYRYVTFNEEKEFYRHQGRELGVGEVKILLENLREGM